MRDLRTAPPPSGSPPPRVAVRPVGLVAGLVLVVHLVAAGVPRRWFDEDLMLAIGRHHLDVGAVDQPPLTPLLARLADTVAPGSQVVLAAPAALAAAVTVGLTALMARELGGDARAQTLAALVQATLPAAVQFGHWLTPYSLEPVLWATVLWLLVRWTRRRDDRLLLVLGLVVGVAVWVRVAVVALGVAVLLAVVVVGPRELLRRPALWAGVAGAVLLDAPTLLWQATHGWPQLAMADVVAAETLAIYGSPLLVALHGLAVVGPAALVLSGVGLVALARQPCWRAYRFVAVAFGLLFTAVVLSVGRHYYLVGLYPALVATGVVVLQHRRQRGHSRRAWPALAATTVLAVAALASSVVLASPRFGDALVEATAAAYRDLPAETRARTALGADPYVYAAFLDAAPPGTGLPPAVGTDRAYGWFAPPPEHQDRLLLVGDPERLAPWFTDVRPVGSVAAPTPLGTYGGLVEESTTVWLLTGRTQPWATIWLQARDLRPVS